MTDNYSDDTSSIQPLPEDNDTPFSEPTDASSDPNTDIDVRTENTPLDPTHQATDSASDIDSQQLYDEGLAGATEVSEPNAGNSVVDYNSVEESDEDNTL